MKKILSLNMAFVLGFLCTAVVFVGGCLSLSDAPFSSENFYERLPENTVAAAHCDLKTLLSEQAQYLRLHMPKGAQGMISATEKFRSEVCGLLEESKIPADLLRHIEDCKVYYAAIPMKTPVVMRNSKLMNQLSERERILFERQSEHVAQPVEALEPNIDESDPFENDGLPHPAADIQQIYTVGHYLVIDTDSSLLAAQTLLNGIRRVEQFKADNKNEKHELALSVTPAGVGGFIWYDLFPGTLQHVQQQGKSVFLYEGKPFPVMTVSSRGQYLIFALFDPMPILDVLDGTSEGGFADKIETDFSASVTGGAVQVPEALNRLRESLKPIAYPDGDPNSFTPDMSATVARKVLDTFDTAKKIAGLGNVRAVISKQTGLKNGEGIICFDGKPQGVLGALCNPGIQLNPSAEFLSLSGSQTVAALNLPAILNAVRDNLDTQGRDGFDAADKTLQTYKSISVAEVAALFKGTVAVNIAFNFPEGDNVKIDDQMLSRSIRYCIECEITDREKLTALFDLDLQKTGDIYYKIFNSESKDVPLTTLVLTDRYMRFYIGTPLDEVIHPPISAQESTLGKLIKRYPNAATVTYNNGNAVRTMTRAILPIYLKTLEDTHQKINEKTKTSSGITARKAARFIGSTVSFLKTILPLIAEEAQNPNSTLFEDEASVGEMKGDMFQFRALDLKEFSR